MIVSIDHLVLTVKDINKTVDFYCNILGMKYEEFKLSKDSNTRKCIKFGKQKINLHEYDNLIIPGAKLPRPGTGDICFISEIDILEWKNIFIKNSINIEYGPTDQVGADGKLRSIYVRDPDENLIEIANKVN
tara:strand:+ start:416 stop:811 length:396 start_codon:yes stop_codon:yes gene_type:complete